MPFSMTGFSRQEISLDSGTLVWEIRSVNHRYLEMTFRLSDSVRELEPLLREKTRNALSRGKVEISFNFQPTSLSQDEKLHLNGPLVEQLAQTIADISARLPQTAAVNPLELLRWPGVIVGEQLDRDLLLKAALDGFDSALNDLIDHRRREGSELRQLIEQRLAGISHNVGEVRQRLPDILQQQRVKLSEKLEALQIEVDKERLEQELVYLAQKSDVDEELDRLDTHCAEVHRVLQQKGSIGRRLDFLMQELNREANTLSSKSIVCDTTQAAVEIKVLIEQMREQIQNIE